MKFSQRGATGLAAGIVCAAVVSLVPGAEAVRQPASSATQVLSAASASVEATAASRGDLTSNVKGTFGKRGVVRGTFDPERFFQKKGTLYAVGTLHATMRRGDGTLVGRADRQVTIPVRNAAATSAAEAGVDRTCSILHLVLGPLDLNLLGLNIHLNRVVLDITATTGSGNLLGNLLCAVAGLLDGSPTLTDLLNLSNILNRILTLLNL